VQTLDYQHIGLHEGSTLQHFLNRAAHEAGQRLQLRIQVRGFEAMCRMVENNVGIAILPHSSALRLSRSMKLALVELTEPWAVRERSVVVQKLDALPLYARELVDFICNMESANAGGLLPAE
jgi:DNA-binding transcriptional LysR family regulator